MFSDLHVKCKYAGLAQGFLLPDANQKMEPLSLVEVLINLGLPYSDDGITECSKFLSDAVKT